MKKWSLTKKIIVFAVIALVIYVIYKNVKGKVSRDTSNVSLSTASTGYSTPVSNTGSTSTTTNSGCTNSTVLKKGSKCDRVQWSQYKINQVKDVLGIAKLTEDGIFGSKTETAFQKLLGKKTGSWNEVKTKVDTMIQVASGNVPGTNINDGFKV